jgi:hypothetical protein
VETLPASSAYRALLRKFLPADEVKANVLGPPSKITPAIGGTQ